MARMLGIYNEARGTDATGVGILLPDGTKMIVKADVRARAFDFKPVEEARVIIGHTRHGTSGDKTARQAHPYNFKGHIFTHNGVLPAGHERNKWAHGPSGVDSETAFRYLVATGGFGNDNLERFATSDDWTGGVFTCAVLEKDNMVTIFKQSNPLHYKEFLPGVFIYSSLKLHVESTLLFHEFDDSAVKDLEYKDVIRITKDGLTHSNFRIKTTESTYKYPVSKNYEDYTDYGYYNHDNRRQRAKFNDARTTSEQDLIDSQTRAALDAEVTG